MTYLTKTSLEILISSLLSVKDHIKIIITSFYFWQVFSFQAIRKCQNFLTFLLKKYLESLRKIDFSVLLSMLTIFCQSNFRETERDIFRKKIMKKLEIFSCRRETTKPNSPPPPTCQSVLSYHIISVNL